MKTARHIVLDALLKMEKDFAYSNIAIDNILTKSDLSTQDKAFATSLFYGVIERMLTLDHCIKKFSKIPLKKINPEVKSILRMGLYQLAFMDGVTDFAAVDECVKLVKASRQSSASGFVNAILRSFIREGKKPNYPDKASNFTAYYSVKYSCPEWIFKGFCKDYGKEHAIELIKASIGRPPLTLKVNTTKTTATELMSLLGEQGVLCEQHPLLNDCIIVEKTLAIDHLKGYRKGFFHVQDVASQLCSRALSPRQNDTVYDMCAAPGGKTFTIAELMNNTGKITAFDLYPAKLKLISDGAKRLGLTNIKTAINDAMDHADLPPADCVLCDVPCSGLGIIRRKPEIKYKSMEDLADLPEKQLDILTTSASYLKVGGTLIYSTCAVSKRENEQVVDAFLQQHPNFEPLSLSEDILSCGISDAPYRVTLLPHISKTDGFFIAKLIRKG